MPNCLIIWKWQHWWNDNVICYRNATNNRRDPDLTHLAFHELLVLSNSYPPSIWYCPNYSTQLAGTTAYYYISNEPRVADFFPSQFKCYNPLDSPKIYYFCLLFGFRLISFVARITVVHSFNTSVVFLQYLRTVISNTLPIQCTNLCTGPVPHFHCC